jgi:prepilin-type N-terminal cleavage/methylation domain-containing protein
MKKGFTLVELIVALTLMTALVGGMMYSFGSGLRNWRKISNRASSLQIKNIIAERLCSDVREAALQTGSTSDEIFLKIGPDLVSYKLIERKIRRKKGAGTAYLTSEDEIKKLGFSYPNAGLACITLDDISFNVYGRNR